MTTILTKRRTRPTQPADGLVSALRAGRAAVLIDDVSTEPLGYLIAPARDIDGLTMSFIVRHSSGFVFVALAERRADRLELPSMAGGGRLCSYGVTVDAREGGSTGISAADRALTARLLADAATSPDQLSRPGHIVPMRSHTDGLRGQVGPAEAAVELIESAGAGSACVLAAVVSQRDATQMADHDELAEFTGRHDLATATISSLITQVRSRSVGAA